MQVDMFFCASISFLLGLLFGSIIMIGINKLPKKLVHRIAPDITYKDGDE